MTASNRLKPRLQNDTSCSLHEGRRAVSPTRKRLLWLAIALLLLVITTGSASAHAYLVKADPAPNSVVPIAPPRVTLWFDESVHPGFSRIQVFDTNQKRWDKDDLSVAPGDPRQLRISLWPLAEGTYTVEWKVLSATDGHITRGVYIFSVGKPSGAPLPTTGGVQSGLDESAPIPVLARWFDLLTILTLVGALLFREAVLMRSLRIIHADDSFAEARWRQLFAVALCGALAGEIARLVLEARLATGAITPDRVAQVLFDTQVGILWITRWVALTVVGLLVLGIRARASLFVAAGESAALVVLYTGILADPRLIGQFGQLWDALARVGVAQHLVHIAPFALFVLLVIFRERTTRRLVTLILAIGVLLTIALGSHAAAQGNGAIAVLADWVHLGAASAWVGGLIAFIWVLPVMWRTLAVDARRTWLAAAASRFSSIALISIAVLVLTGIYQARLEIPSLDGWRGTLYGQALAAKIVLFAFLLGAGAVQLFGVRGLIMRGSGKDAARVFHSFARLVLTEVALGIVIVGLAGLLTLVPPARNPNPPLVGEPPRACIRDASADCSAPELPRAADQSGY